MDPDALQLLQTIASAAEELRAEVHALRAEVRELKADKPSALAVPVSVAAERLGCSRSRVFQLLRMGVLEKAPKLGREIRIYTASVTSALTKPEPTRGRKARTAKRLTPPPVSLSNIRL